MKKKLFGLAAALGVTVLASWAAPAVATTTPLPLCHLRLCLGRDPSTPCYCRDVNNTVSTCGTFQGAGGCPRP